MQTIKKLKTLKLYVQVCITALVMLNIIDRAILTSADIEDTW